MTDTAPARNQEIARRHRWGYSRALKHCRVADAHRQLQTRKLWLGRRKTLWPLLHARGDPLLHWADGSL